MSDIEGKVAREAMSECGQRASFQTGAIRPSENLMLNTLDATPSASPYVVTFPRSRSTSGVSRFPIHHVSFAHQD
jgi:hypothetical protein